MAKRLSLLLLFVALSFGAHKAEAAGCTPFFVASGGTGGCSYPINSILTSGITASGAFQATSSQPLYVGSIFATSSSLVSTFAGGFVSQASSTIIGNFTVSTLAGSGTRCIQASSVGLISAVTGACGTVTSVATDATLTGGPITTTGTLGINLANPNTWSGGQIFANTTTTNATSTSLFSSLITANGPFSVGTTSTTTLWGNATSTYSGGLNLTAGCLAYGGTCLTAGLILGGGTEAVNYATNAILSGTPTYANGSAGVGATLTEVGFGALSVDGTTVSVGNRILVKDQADQTTDGIYTVTAVGSGIAAYILTRATDYNTPTEITPGLNTYVVSGTANSDTTWAVSYTPPLTIGSTNITYIESSIGSAAVPNTRNINTTYPLTGGGNLTADRTFACAACDLFGQSLAIDALNWISPTTTFKYGISAGGQGTTYGFGLDDVLIGYASSTNRATLFGIGAGGQNATTSATQNSVTAYGYQALNANTTGSNNSAFGPIALWSNTTGFNNAAFGVNALFTNTTGHDNIAFGPMSLNSNVSGSYLTAIGNAALYYTTAASSTGIGYQAYQNLTSGILNIGIGINAGNDTNPITGSNNIVIGNYAITKDKTASGLLNIGNLLFGTGLYTGTSLSQGAVSGGKFGVASTSPWAALSVSSANSASIFPIFAVASSSSAVATSTYFAVNASGGIELSAEQPATTTAITLDWANSSPQREYRIGISATTITLINATTSQQWGSRKIVWVCNPGTTAGALTWVGVEWVGMAPTQTTSANQCDIYSFDITRATSTTAYKVAGTGGTGFQ